MNPTSRRPSAALVLAALSLVVSLGGTAYATGGAGLLLGHANRTAKSTALSSKASGGTLKLRNKGAGPAASFTSRPGVAPFTVSGSDKVSGLNGDLLDGLDSSAFVRSGTPLDAGTLDGLDSSAFRKSADQVDAATLDGLDSSSFLRSDTTPLTAEVFGSTNPSVPTGSGASLGATSERYDPSDLHTNNGTDIFTVPKTGTYVVSATVRWIESNGVGFRRLSLSAFDGSVGITIANQTTADPGAGQLSQNASGVVHLPTGSVINLHATQGSGGALDCFLDAMQIAYVGP